MTDHHIPSDVQDDMLFAVNWFDEAYKTHPSGSPRDYTPHTEDFWKALGQWAPFALVGDFDMTTDTTTGEVNIKFTPKPR